MQHLYTAGYRAGWTPHSLLAEATRLNAVVLDIRLNPTSMQPDWRKHELARALGGRYQHVPELGNLNYQGGPITIANLPVGLAHIRHELAHRSVILLCACANHQTCHRTTVVAELPHLPVIHLAPPAPTIDAGTLLALTIRQPWAWLCLHGKDIENRSWPTSVRGRIAIHAGKGMTKAEYADGVYVATACGVRLPPMAELVRGAVLGTVDLIDCVTESDSDWFAGDFGFVLRDPRPFTTPDGVQV
jgi:hypothetical protein